MVPVAHGPPVPVGPAKDHLGARTKPTTPGTSRGRFVLDPPSRPHPRPSRGSERMRRLRHLSLAAVSVLLVTACSQATAGWTYAPAPSKTVAPAASGSGAPGSAAPSGGASGAPASAAPSGGASGAPASAAPSGGASAAPSGQPSPGGSGQLAVVNISATGIKYDQTEVTAPANTPFQIQFANNDAGVP